VAVDRTQGLVAVSSGVALKLYDLWSGKPKADLPGCASVLRGGLAFDGGRLVVACENEVAVVDVTAGKLQPVPDVVSEPITAVAFAPGRFAVGQYDGVIRVHSLAGGDRVDIAVPGPPIDVKSLALSPDGSRVAVAWVQGSVWHWKVAASSAPERLVRHPSESDAVVFSADGRYLAEEGEPHQTTVWDFESTPAKEIARVRNGDWIKQLAFTADGSWLTRGGSDGLEVAEVRGPRRVALDTSGQVEDVALDSGRTLVAAVERKGRLTVWAPK
jgi:WD40 repeat protein